MSIYFDVDSKTVWNPALRVGQLYVGYVRAVEVTFSLSAGIETTNEDVVRIDLEEFGRFVQELVRSLSRTNSEVLLLQLRAVILPAVVMLSRAGWQFDSPEMDGVLAEAQKFWGIPQ